MGQDTFNSLCSSTFLVVRIKVLFGFQRKKKIKVLDLAKIREEIMALGLVL